MGADIFVFCFAEDFMLRMDWLDAMGFDRIQWNGAAGASIFKEASSQGYVTNKVELVSLACVMPQENKAFENIMETGENSGNQKFLLCL